MHTSSKFDFFFFVLARRRKRNVVSWNSAQRIIVQARTHTDTETHRERDTQRYIERLLDGQTQFRVAKQR